ncbi:DUF4954 family protein [bacterium]|nr:DUF4954 family protein [bacterium]
MPTERHLSGDEIAALERRGCSCEDWQGVCVDEGFDPARVWNVRFVGRVRVGRLTGTVQVERDLELPCEIRDATLIDCDVGDGCRISQVGRIARCEIDEGAVIEHVGALVARQGARFGNGAVAKPVNEAGGRDIRLFNRMSGQFAYIYCMHRGRKELTGALDKIIDAEIEISDVGMIGRNARISGVNEIIDVAVGAHAEIIGASSLRNGTILSEAQSPARVGGAVVASDFMIGEGSIVESGAVLERVFVGQGVQIGKNFSAQDSLFFANCEAFHGEACSIFAGPFTVTHHKNTLLIAAMYSFFNAGSGTNHSNHMYKLGPVHQGVFARGSKTGSYAYMFLPSVVGPFSVVLGRHESGFDAGEFPFSYIVAEAGRPTLMPAMNLFKIGIVRDSGKWPRRDRRTATKRRDLINYELFSPYVMALMMRAEEILGGLSTNEESVLYRGLTIRRGALSAGVKTYAAAIDAWLARKIVKFVVPPSVGIGASKSYLPPEGGTTNFTNWSDVAGLFMSRAQLGFIEQHIESGAIASLDDFDRAMAEAANAYDADEQAWARVVFESRTGQSVDSLSTADIDRLAAQASAWDAMAHQKLLADAAKEFNESAKFSYGLDSENPDVDFESVRGRFETNPNIQQIQAKQQNNHT